MFSMSLWDFIGLSLQDNHSQRCFLIFAELDYSLLLLKTTGNNLMRTLNKRGKPPITVRRTVFVPERTYERKKTE